VLDISLEQSLASQSKHATEESLVSTTKLRPAGPLRMIFSSHFASEHKHKTYNNAHENHRHGVDKYLDTLLANQTAQKALPPTTARSRNRKMVDC